MNKGLTKKEFLENTLLPKVSNLCSSHSYLEWSSHCIICSSIEHIFKKTKRTKAIIIHLLHFEWGRDKTSYTTSLLYFSVPSWLYDDKLFTICGGNCVCANINLSYWSLMFAAHSVHATRSCCFLSITLHYTE